MQISNSDRAYVKYSDAGGNMLLGTVNAQPIGFQIGGATAMTLDASGNLGLGVTPPTQNGGTGMWFTKGAVLSDGNSFYPEFTMPTTTVVGNTQLLDLLNITFRMM
jgi:hypothetical protein